MDRKTILMGASALAIAASVGVPALAQPAKSAESAASPAQATALEEVLVTARKREESLQDIPIAVTAATGEQLQRVRIDEPNDLARLVPSMTVSSVPGGGASSVFISLRGQRAADTLLTVSQPVGIYEDGVNIPHPVGANASFYDLERVEVLKGPQGTLYGRNTTAGAINIITRSPDSKEMHGFLEGELSNNDGYRIGGAVNIPIIKDVLAVRLTGQHWERDGYAKSIINGQTIGGDHDDNLIRVGVSYTPTDNFRALAKYEYAKIKWAGLPYSIVFRTPLYNLLSAPEINNAGGAAGLALVTACTNTGDIYKTCQQLNQRDDTEVQHASLDMTYDFSDNLSLRSITGYHYFKNFRVFDLDGTPFTLGENGYGIGGAQPNVGLATVPAGARLPNGTLAPTGPFLINTPLVPDQESGQFTQEFNLSGNVGIVDWLVGAFYSDDDGNGSQATVRNPASAIRTAPYFAPSANSFEGLDVKAKTYAFFGQGDIKVNDQLSFTLGLRYTKEKLSQLNASWVFNQNFNSAVAPIVSGPGRNFQCTFGPFAGATVADSFGPARPFVFQSSREACAVTQKADFDGVSYLGSVNYKITPGILVYAKVSKGFRGGALQLRAPYVPAVEPETAKDIELGLKGDFWENRLRLNLAAYRTNYTNQQFTNIEFVPGQPTTRTTVLRNAPSARYQGVELEWRVLPFEGFSFSGNVGWLDAYYRHWANAPAPLGNPAPATLVVDGTQVELPKWTGNLSARYEHEVGPGVLGAQLGLNFFTDTPLTALGNEALVPDSWERWVRKGRQLVTARIDYEVPEYGLTLALWATNLTDERYGTPNIVSTANGGLYEVLPREPRMYGVTIRKTFGPE